MSKIITHSARVGIAGLCITLALVGCSKSESEKSSANNSNQPVRSKFLSGQITIDGSSTVYPITDAAASEFKKIQPNVWMKVELSGSGQGLRRLLDGEIPMADASRCIKNKEVTKAAQANFDFIELPVAFDGIAVVVNEANDWVDYLTVAELRKIWQPDSTVKYWSDIRSSWPKEEIHLCAPTSVSGTFEFFTKAICGKAGAIRSDYFAHEDEHVLAPYVIKHHGGLSFFGYGWYKSYSKGLRAVPVKHGDNTAVAVTVETIADGSYAPLSRPLFVYIARKAADRPELSGFVNFYLASADKFVTKAGYVPLPAESYKLVRQRFESRTVGSAFCGAEKGLSLDTLLKSTNAVMTASMQN